MIHHVLLFKLKPSVTVEKLEEMMIGTRMSLLKIPEVLSMKCGKNVDPKSEWAFFIAVDFETMEKLAIYRDDAIHMKFLAEIIEPNTTDRMALDYEMDPGKTIK